MHYIVKIIALFIISSAASAGVIWDESINGDLGDELAAPTVIGVSAGSNIIHGGVGPESSDWRDIFSLDVSADLYLTNIFVDFFSLTESNSSTFLLSPITETCNCGGYDVYSLLTESSIGEDIGAQFIPSYNNDLSQYFSLWEAQSNPAEYSLNFVFASSATSVPEPSSLMLLLLGAGALLVRRKQSK